MTRIKLFNTEYKGLTGFVLGLEVKDKNGEGYYLIVIDKTQNEAQLFKSVSENDEIY